MIEITDTPQKVIHGMEVWRNPRNRFVVLKTFYYADPMKDPDRLVCTDENCRHFIKNRVGQLGKPCRQKDCDGTYYDYGPRFHREVVMSRAENLRQQEYLINFRVRGGKRVYAPFDANIHTGDFSAPPRAVLYRGWDFGQHHPACVVCFDNTYVDRFEVLQAFIGFNLTFRVFCKAVAEYCEQLFPHRQFIDGVDPQGSWASGQGGVVDDRDNETPVAHMEDVWQMNVDWSNILPRDARDQINEQITRRAADNEGNMPFGVHVNDSAEIYSRAPNSKIIAGTKVIIDGMSGEYRYSKKLDGTYSRDPVKNLFSHPADAMMYAFLRARTGREEDRNEEYAKTLLATQLNRVRREEGADKYNTPRF